MGPVIRVTLRLRRESQAFSLTGRWYAIALATLTCPKKAMLFSTRLDSISELAAWLQAVARVAREKIGWQGQETLREGTHG